MPYSADLSFNSDLPMDKVIWLYMGETTTDSWGSWNVTIPHKLAAIPFVKGIWSSNDWATTWLTGSRRLDGDYYTDFSDVASDGTNVYFGGYTNSANAKVKYKLWGVWNENETYSTPAEFTKNLSTNQYIINSDYNYPQLVMEGYLDKGNSITHSLGFIPYCDVWSYEIVGNNNQYGYRQWNNDTFGDLYGTGQVVQITNNSLTLNSNQTAPSKIYYRIYAT